jgi:rRNA maturation RNase YbeY
VKKGRIRGKLEKVFGDLGCLDKEVSILFTDDHRMAQLNLRYMDRSGPTNVLAFPMIDYKSASDQPYDFDTGLLGDVAISVDTAQREAEELGETLEQRIDRLLVHGILHLLGYDHVAGEEEAVRMETEEDRLMSLIDY